jgi:hypothetical protein
MAVNREVLAHAEMHDDTARVVLDIDSSESAVQGETVESSKHDVAARRREGQSLCAARPRACGHVQLVSRSSSAGLTNSRNLVRSTSSP